MYWWMMELRLPSLTMRLWTRVGSRLLLLMASNGSFQLSSSLEYYYLSHDAALHVRISIRTSSLVSGPIFHFTALPTSHHASCITSPQSTKKNTQQLADSVHPPLNSPRPLTTTVDVRRTVKCSTMRVGVTSLIYSALILDVLG